MQETIFVQTNGTETQVIRQPAAAIDATLIKCQTVTGVAAVVMTLLSSIVLPLFDGSWQFLNLLAALAVSAAIIIMVQYPRNSECSVHSTAKRFWLRILVMIVSFFSVCFFLPGIYELYMVIAGQDSINVSLTNAVQNITAAVLYTSTAMSFLGAYCVGKTVSDGQKTAIVDSNVRTAVFTSLTLLSTIYFSCFMQQLFMLKSTDGYFTWYKELAAVMASETPFDASFTITPITVPVFFDALGMMFTSKLTCIAAIILMVMPFAVPVAAACKGTYIEARTLIKEVIAFLRKSVIIGRIMNAIQNPGRGYCVECECEVDMVRFVPFSRPRLTINEDDIVPRMLETVQNTMDGKGVAFRSEDLVATYLRHDAKVFRKNGEKLRTLYCCKNCGMTIYPQFAGRRTKGTGIVNIQLLGDTSSGKSSLLTTLYHYYGRLIKGTPEYQYFEKLYMQLIKDHKAPESDRAVLVKSPVLMMEHDGKYIAIHDVAGERSEEIGFKDIRGGIYVFMIDIGSSDSFHKAFQYLAMLHDPAKIVICITKIDKYPEYDCMEMPDTQAEESSGGFRNTVAGAAHRLTARKDSEQARTQRFVQAFANSKNFSKNFNSFYERCCELTKRKERVAVVAHAALGTDTDTNYVLKGEYAPKYIAENLSTFIS